MECLVKSQTDRAAMVTQEGAIPLADGMAMAP